MHLVEIRKSPTPPLPKLAQLYTNFGRYHTLKCEIREAFQAITSIFFVPYMNRLLAWSILIALLERMMMTWLIMMLSHVKTPRPDETVFGVWSNLLPGFYAHRSKGSETNPFRGLYTCHDRRHVVKMQKYCGIQFESLIWFSLELLQWFYRRVPRWVNKGFTDAFTSNKEPGALAKKVLPHQTIVRSFTGF